MIFWLLSAILTGLSVALLWVALLAGKATRRHKVTATLVALITPLVALGLYWQKGSIGMPDFPASALASDEQKVTEALLLDERPLIRHLRDQPDNEKLWIDLITLYLRTNRPQQAVQAYADARKSVRRPILLNNKALNALRRPVK